MKIETKFLVGDVVRIKELDCSGTVRAVWFKHKEPEYLVRYSGSNEFLEVYFFENEIE